VACGVRMIKVMPALLLYFLLNLVILFYIKLRNFNVNRIPYCCSTNFSIYLKCTLNLDTDILCQCRESSHTSIDIKKSLTIDIISSVGQNRVNSVVSYNA
jgi:hypothetical protein